MQRNGTATALVIFSIFGQIARERLHFCGQLYLLPRIPLLLIFVLIVHQQMS